MTDDAARARRLLDARTRALAARRTYAGPAAPTVPHLLVGLAAGLHALPLVRTRGVARATPATPLPGCHPAVLGLVHHGGRFVAVLDLAAALGLPAEAGDDGADVFLRCEPPLALRVSAALGTVDVAANLLPAPDAGRTADPVRLDGAPGGGAVLLDPVALVAPLFPQPPAFGS